MSKPEGLDELIAALQIFRKYGNPAYPTHCEHDVMMICGIEPDDVSDADKAALDDMGFLVCGDGFHSYRFGSA